MRTYERIMRHLWWVPNAISLFRGLIAAPTIFGLFVWEFLAKGSTAVGPEIIGDYKLWIFLLAATGAVSDAIDGFLAKKFARFGWQTERGVYVDAYCDKFLGLAILFGVPLHFPLGMYLPLYTMTGVGIVAYGVATTKMRHSGEIKNPNRLAQEKTAILMAIKFFIAGVIAVEDQIGPQLQETALWIGTLGLVVALVYCAYALEKYKRDAQIA